MLLKSDKGIDTISEATGRRRKMRLRFLNKCCSIEGRRKAAENVSAFLTKNRVQIFRVNFTIEGEPLW